MKHLVLLLLPLLAISLPCTAGVDTQLVYDTEEHELSSDFLYYILSADRRTSGGLGVLHENRPCHFFVVQAPGEAAVGMAVKFESYTASSDGAVRLSTNVTIGFDVITTCVESMDWYVTNSSLLSSSEPHEHVAVGKDEDEDYIRSPAMVFRIEKYDGATEGYKLVSCAGDGPCKDLGLHTSG
ncbi:alpha-amylase/subtilisin inhibitor-like [Phragmites australis]|uniref:alpha-amylase/subtilisin inhibitor-like n=1 Tax=Phragmites australis TaxID=29695 RepID=UPI002D79DD80|nr:alpha-amylase/subtilisin inhibitor-like [Phragmites australis]